MNTARGTAALSRCLQPGLVFGGRVPGSPGEAGGTAGGCGEPRGAAGSGEELRGAPGPAEGAERPREAARGRGRGAVPGAAGRRPPAPVSREGALPAEEWIPAFVP